MYKVRMSGSAWRKVVVLLLVLFCIDAVRLATFEPLAPRTVQHRGAMSLAKVLHGSGIAFAQDGGGADCSADLAAEYGQDCGDEGGGGDGSTPGDANGGTDQSGSVWPASFPVWGSYKGVFYAGTAVRVAGSSTYTFDMDGEDGSTILGHIDLSLGEAIMIDLGFSTTFSSWQVETYSF